MDCGTLRKQLRKGLDANFKGNEDRDASRGKQSKKGLAANSKGDERRDAFQRIVLKTIREMVRIGTEVTRMAQQAFFGNLLKDMYDWYDTGGARGRPRNPAATETIVLADMVRTYRQWLRAAGLEQTMPNLKGYITQGLSPFFQNIGLRLCDQIQSHFLRNISELLHRLQNHNSPWCNSAQGRRVIRTVGDDGKSSVHDQVSLFWILNSHLPDGQQMAFLPESGFTDQFFGIPERSEIDEFFGDYQENRPRFNRRYVLTGTIVTNGYELKLMAYSLTESKPPPHPVPNTTQFKLKSILTELSDSTQVDDMFPGDRYVVTGIDPGIHNTATATVLDSDKTDGSAINLSISQGSQTYSAKQYMKELNRAKQRKTFNDINQLEQSITPITCQQAGQVQTGSWRTLAASIRACVHSVIRVQGYLREFYGSYIFKMKSRHLKQAKMATLNRGVSKLLRTAGCKEKWIGNDTRALFAVGDGNFGSTRGPQKEGKLV
ncbi:hypothetical protein BGX21_005718 [Mortierella sp. AD011]|nr:hypothetical protein BGX21_005718 [Mortierella sp. AD011]